MKLRDSDDGVVPEGGYRAPTSGATVGTETVLPHHRHCLPARERLLWLTTAYFVPDWSYEDILCDAARLSVYLRLLVTFNATTDVW